MGKVLVNHRAEQTVTVQPHRAQWSGMRIRHLPQYQTPGGGYVDDAEGRPVAKGTVRYEALVLQIELLVGGELSHVSSRQLSDRGWPLKVAPEEGLAHLTAEGGRVAPHPVPGRGANGAACWFPSARGVDGRCGRHGNHTVALRG